MAEAGADISYYALEIKLEPLDVEIDRKGTQQINYDVEVKEEETVGSYAGCKVTQEAAKELYKNHTIKQEQVIGPVLLQPVILNAEGMNSSELNSKSTRSPNGQFRRKHELYLHREQRFQCIICSKNFTKKQELDMHKTVHTEDKPFQCEICTKTFSRKSYVTMHQRIHSVPQTMHKCEFCQKYFTLRRYLMCHLQTHNRSKLIRTAVGKTRFHCGICQKFVYNKSDFERHKLLHLL